LPGEEGSRADPYQTLSKKKQRRKRSGVVPVTKKKAPRGAQKRGGRFLYRGEEIYIPFRGRSDCCTTDHAPLSRERVRGLPALGQRKKLFTVLGITTRKVPESKGGGVRPSCQRINDRQSMHLERKKKKGEGGKYLQCQGRTTGTLSGPGSLPSMRAVNN